MSKSTKRIVIFAILLVLTAGAAFSVMANQIISKRVQLSDQVEALRTERAQETSRIQLQRLAADTEAERAELSSYFLLQESQSIDFLNQLEMIAPQAGVALDVSDVNLVDDKVSGKTWIEADFSFSGSRADVQRFVQILETMPYISRLQSVQLESQTSAVWKAEVIMQVQLLSYENS